MNMFSQSMRAKWQLYLVLRITRFIVQKKKQFVKMSKCESTLRQIQNVQTLDISKLQDSDYDFDWEPKNW